MAFHKVHGTFATGGADGRVTFWDHANRSKLKSESPFSFFSPLESFLPSPPSFLSLQSDLILLPTESISPRSPPRPSRVPRQHPCHAHHLPLLQSQPDAPRCSGLVRLGEGPRGKCAWSDDDEGEASCGEARGSYAEAQGEVSAEEERRGWREGCLLACLGCCERGNPCIRFSSLREMHRPTA